jgi:hypothetical protein
VSSSDCRRILDGGRLLPGRLFAERSRDRQSDCRDDREQRHASRSGKAGGPEHEQGAGVANFRLVQERVAFDYDKCRNRRP